MSDINLTYKDMKRIVVLTITTVVQGGVGDYHWGFHQRAFYFFLPMYSIENIVGQIYQIFLNRIFTFFTSFKSF